MRARHAWALVGALATGATAFADGEPIGLGAPIDLVGSGAAGDVVVADVTGDGKLDVVLLPGGVPRVTVHPGRGGGAFDAPFDLATSVPVTRAHAVRLNADAADDLVLTHGRAGGVDVLLSDGAGGFARTSYPAAPPPPPSQFAYALGEYSSVVDWDGDGKLDWVGVDAAAFVRVRLGDGAGGFGPAVQSAFRLSQFGAADALVTDLDGDGDLDIAIFDAAVHVFWRQSDGSLSPGVVVSWLSVSPARILARDMDADGRADLVVASGSFVAVFLQGDDASFGEGRFSVSGLGRIALADLNDDGLPEIATTASILVNRGDGRFAPPLALPRTGACVAFAELTGDGRPDVVVAGGTGAAEVVPVTASAAPLPSLTSFSPAVLHVGASLFVTVEWTGVAAGATIDFGAGGGVDEWLERVTTATSVSTRVAVRADAVPGPRVFTIVNPDGSSASIPFEVVAGGDAVVSSLTPERAYPGESLRVVVRGAGFTSGASPSIWSGVPFDGNYEVTVGVVVESAEFVNDGEMRLVVSVNPLAAAGDRTFRVLNGTGVHTEFAGLFRVLPPPMIRLVPKQGLLKPSAGRGSFSAAGTLAFERNPPEIGFNPRTEEAEIRVGEPTAPLVVKIPAGDGWRFRRGRAVWKSPRGQTPRVRFVLDLDDGSFRVDVSRADIAPPETSEVAVDLTLGDESGKSVLTWSPSRRGGLELK